MDAIVIIVMANMNQVPNFVASVTPVFVIEGKGKMEVIIIAAVVVCVIAALMVIFGRR